MQEWMKGGNCQFLLYIQHNVSGMEPEMNMGYSSRLSLTDDWNRCTFYMDDVRFVDTRLTVTYWIEKLRFSPPCEEILREESIPWRVVNVSSASMHQWIAASLPPEWQHFNVYFRYDTTGVMYVESKINIEKFTGTSPSILPIQDGVYSVHFHVHFRFHATSVVWNLNWT